MQFRTIPTIAALFMVAMPVSVRVTTGDDGSFCPALSANDAGAQGRTCWCFEKDGGNSCTEPNWAVMCIAEQEGVAPISSRNIDDDALLLAGPVN